MKIIKVRATLVALALVALAGCGPDNASRTGTTPSTSAPASSSAPASPTSSSSEYDVMVADSSLGKIIVDGQGRTAYYFTKDTADSCKSACADACLSAWPAIVATSDTPKGEGVTAKLGTITRDDLTQQVTVNGLPIYLFAKDTKAGEVNGQGVGKVWYVIAPDGKMITNAT